MIITIIEVIINIVGRPAPLMIWWVTGLQSHFLWKMPLFDPLWFTKVNIEPSLKEIFWWDVITFALLHFWLNPTCIATFITRSPVDQSVENNQGCDWENYVADRCQPQHVDVKVPDSGHRILKTYLWILNSYIDIDTSKKLFYVNNKWTTPIKVREKTIPIVCPQVSCLQPEDWVD